jgi:biopolymer transport protein ExbB/TolQ
MSELKVDFPPEERPTTSVNVWVNTLMAVFLTLGILVAVYQMDNKAFTRELLLGQKKLHKEGQKQGEVVVEKETWVSKLNMNVERTIFQGLTLFMWTMSGVCVGLKFVRLRKEFKLVRSDLIPSGLMMKSMAPLIDLHAQLMANKYMGKTLVMTRLGRILSMWINTEDFERTAQYAKQENEMDIFIADSSYRANRLYIWAMPLLGFVGTVYGVSYGIGGFADFLRGQVTSEEIKYQVGLITEGLAVAFYCTLLGLMTAGLAAFPSLAAEKREEELLNELDALVEDRLVSRMPSVRKTEFPKEDIQAMREGIERMKIDLSSEDLVTAIKGIKIDFPMDEFTAALQNIKFNLPMDELTEVLRNMKFNLPMEEFVTGIKEGLQDLRVNVIMPMEDLTRAIDMGFRRLPDPDKYVTVFSRAIADASGLVSQKYEEFARSYEHRIGQLSEHLASKLDVVASGFHQGTQQLASELGGHAREITEMGKSQATQWAEAHEAYLEALARRTSEDVHKWQTTAEQFRVLAGDMAGQLKEAVVQMHTSAAGYATQIRASNEALAEQVSRIVEVGAGIDRMLDATRAAEQALHGVGSIAEFGKLLSTLSEHLSASDELAKKLAKPKRIVLQESMQGSSIEG